MVKAARFDLLGDGRSETRAAAGYMKSQILLDQAELGFDKINLRLVPLSEEILHRLRQVQGRLLFTRFPEMG